MKQAADMTGYRPMYIYQLVKQNKIPCIRTNGRLLFERHTLDNWVQAGKTDMGKLMEQILSRTITDNPE